MNARYSRLPEGVEDVLPPAARELESLRRKVLDMFHTHGYDYVISPVFEYLDSLLVGVGADLELQTFTFTDRQSGRLLGLRADLTSQALRIDASRLRGDGVLRLCYAGPVARAQPEGVFPMRETQILGAELFGSQSQSADAEIVALMAQVLSIAGIEEPFIEVGHLGVVTALLGQLELGDEARADLYTALHRKAADEVRELTKGNGKAASALIALTDLFGGVEVLASARDLLKNVSDEALTRVDELESFLELLRGRSPSARLQVDLAEITGFAYHTGLVFAAYSEDSGQVLARGGRYDGLGAHYGRARPAVGFDVDLARIPVNPTSPPRIAWVPVADDTNEARRDKIKDLRDQGWRIVEALSREETAPAHASHRLAASLDGSWQLEPTAEPD